MIRLPRSGQNKSTMQHKMKAISNSDILTGDPGKTSSRLHLFEMPVDGTTSQNLTFLAKRYRQPQTHFQNGDSEAQPSELLGVYIVAQPNRWHRLLTSPIQGSHWSLYTQGHYYHLVKSGNTHGSSILRDDDYSAPQDLSKAPPAHPFVAYHIGTTDYSPAQIYQLAEWATSNLADNGFSAAASQQFVSELGARIICGPRNSTVLMGDLLQIAEQEFHLDTNLSDAPIPSGYSTGVQLAGPDVPIDTAGKRLRLRFQVESSARSLALGWKDGTRGTIDWTTHEYHPLLRPLAVANQWAALRSLETLKRTYFSTSNWFPPQPSQCTNNMPLASIYRYKKGEYSSKDLELVPFFGDLHYIRATRTMTPKEFTDQVNSFLAHATSHMTYNQGFGADLVRQEEITAMMSAKRESSMLQIMHSTVDPGQALDQELRLFDTISTNEMETRAARCQIFVDMGHHEDV